MHDGVDHLRGELHLWREDLEQTAALDACDQTGFWALLRQHHPWLSLPFRWPWRTTARRSRTVCTALLIDRFPQALAGGQYRATVTAHPERPGEESTAAPRGTVERS